MKHSRPYVMLVLLGAVAGLIWDSIRDAFRRRGEP